MRQCSRADRLLVKDSAGQASPQNYKAFWTGQCSWASRLLVKDSDGQPSQKHYKAFSNGQCRWADRLLVKDCARHPPPQNKLQGVLDRAMKLGKQVIGEK